MANLTQPDLSVFGKLRTVSDYDRVNKNNARMEQEFELKKQMIAQKMANAASGRDLPAALQIANAYTTAQKAGDAQTVQAIELAAKMFDKGIVSGGAMPPQQPTPPMPSPPANNQPSTAPSTGNLGDTELPQDFLSAMTGAPNQAPPTTAPKAIPGYAAAVGGIAGAKAGAAQDAKNKSDLGFKPKIKAAESDALYLTEGRQKLPLAQRSLQDVETREAFLQPKFNNIRTLAQGITTGFGGSLSSSIPGTPAYDLRREVDTLLANAGFDRLQEMRSNSPTGGALGAVSERELELLQSAAQNLQASQSKEQFLQNLDLFEQQRAASLANIRKAYDEDYQRFGGQSDPVLPSPRETTPPVVAPPQGNPLDIEFKLRKAGYTPEQIKEYKRAKGL